jgi:2-methylcitrate dehydratase PrpD
MWSRCPAPVRSEGKNVTASESLTGRVADFAVATRYEDIPPEALRLGNKALLDCLGLALAGSRADGADILRNHIAQLGCANKSSTLFGTAMRAPARFAALANATAMHADDYDDTHNPSRIHPSAPVAAALLAVAEAQDSSGRDLLSAFNVGVEVSCKISIATGGAHYGRGYHSTGSCGVFGATAGLCNLKHLPPDVACAALGIAGSEAAGLRENFGTMTKPLHAGRAAENAVVAADLAASGFTAAPTVLEGPRGFFKTCVGQCDEDVLLHQLGKPWTIVSPGIAVKPFPSGRLAHPGMCKLEEIVTAHDIRPEQVERIEVKTNRELPGNLTYHHPTTGLQGKFSMEFCLASILVLRRAGLSEFTDAVVNRDDIQEAIRKIRYTCYDDREAETNKYPLLTTFIEVVLKDGRRFAGRADVARGSPPIAMTEAEVAAKFRDCAAFAGWPQRATERIVEITFDLDKLPRIAQLMKLLAAH